MDEEIDDATYEKQIVMTENGIALAEFLNQLEKPEQEEFSSYIYNIYNTLNNAEQWEENPYVNGIKNINKNARDLSKALKKLSTFIRKIIEKMVQEKTLESLTENILEYCEGNFIREYSRLTKQQNIHIYRMFIKTKLDTMLIDDTAFGRMVEDCCKEENIDYVQAQDAVLDMIQATKRFLVEDYDQIMRDIKHKINVYLQIAVGRARFIRNREKDVRGNVERTMRFIMEELTELSMKDVLPDDMNVLFTMNRHEFIDEGSIRYPRQNQTIKAPVVSEIEEMTEDAIRAAREAQQKEAYNPYSRDLMKIYLEKKMGDSGEISSDELPLNSKGDMLVNLSSIAYAKDNGFAVEILDGYYEGNDKYRKKICKMLCTYMDFSEKLVGIDDAREREKIILEEFNIYTNPSYVYLKGGIKLCLDTGNTIQIDSAPMALSSDLIKQIVSINVERKNIVTVENLTSFHRVKDENCAYIYLAGYHNSEKQALLRRINKENPQKNWYHFGDIDPDGFYILEHLRKGTGIDFEPFCMSVNELRNNAKHCKELSGQDEVKAANLISRGRYVETLQYMLDNNCKLEQEIISISRHYSPFSPQTQCFQSF